VLHKINGLPAHILLVHAVVILVPLAALMLVASAVWPAARAKLGFLTPAVALVALILVPITTSAGHWFKDHIGFTNADLEHHAALGGELIWWVIPLFVLAAAVWLIGRRYSLQWRSADDSAAGGALPVWVTAVVAVLAIGVAAGTVITVVRIGDAGSRSAYGHTLDNCHC
jgi:hypothetical protein